MNDISRALIDELNDLIALDHDAIDAYQAAIDRLEDATAANQLRSFMADHERHTVELGACVTQLGGQPARKGDLKRFLTQGKVVLGGLIGDRQILTAMRSNEDDTNRAYEQALETEGLSTHTQVRTLLERNLNDERRHREWIVNYLHALQVARR